MTHQIFINFDIKEDLVRNIFRFRRNLNLKENTIKEHVFSFRAAGLGFEPR
jgi:hypothetical protein